MAPGAGFVAQPGRSDSDARLSNSAVMYVLMRNGPYELVIAPPGYPGMKYRGRYCYEHTLVWWQNTGEIPGPGEVLHHRDENKRNNAFDNLAKKTVGEHTAEHSRARIQVPVTVKCSWCLSDIQILGRVFKTKTKQGQHRFYCNHRCQILKQWSDAPMR
jgi:HNH endonuclease